MAARDRAMTGPSVSIIIPCYNAETWLAQTLESALAQTWPHKEIILINDGSRDGSLRVARRFKSKGVQIVDQSNQGASAARNHGLRLAGGDFIQFLDADDLLSPAKIERQVALLAERPGNTVASCTWGRFRDSPADARFIDTAVFRDFAPLDFLVLAGETGAMMHPSSWLVPRAVATLAGPWDESLSLNDDGEYFCRVLLASTAVAFCPDDTVRSYYRSGLPGSLSQQRNDQARRSQFRALELITAALRAAEDSPRVRRASAGYWRSFVHDFFPAPAELIQRAESEVRRLGEEIGPPSMGPRTAVLAAVLGWRNVWRLKHWMSR